MLDCTFCENFLQFQTLTLNNRQLNTTIYENDDILVCADLSPLTVGHLLLVSKKHYDCYSVSPENVLLSLQNVLDIMLTYDIYEDGYCIFEHGSVGCKTSGTCINHAHLHLVPIGIEFNDVKMYFNNQFVVNEMPNILSLNDQKNNKSYLLLGGSKIGLKRVDVDILPSQFMRMYIKNKNNETDYNWRYNYNTLSSKDKLLNTINYFAANEKLNMFEMVLNR